MMSRAACLRPLPQALPEFCNVIEPVESIKRGLTGQCDVQFFGKFDKFFTDKNIVEDLELPTFIEASQIEVDVVKMITNNMDFFRSEKK